MRSMARRGLLALAGGDRPSPGIPPQAPGGPPRQYAARGPYDPGTQSSPQNPYGDAGGFGAPRPGWYDAPDGYGDHGGYDPYGDAEGDDAYNRTRRYELDWFPTPAEPSRLKGRAKKWIMAGVSLLALSGIAAGVMTYFEIPPFTDKGAEVSFGAVPKGEGSSGQASGARQKSSSKVSMPTGPQADFKNEKTLDDGTHVAVTKLDGKKSGFTGKVWVWAPKQYFDPKYANSGFPVMIALPGGAGFPTNYWMGSDLGLQKSIAKWSEAGESKPFLLAMPVLNPAPDKGGLYWDGSDIPGQPKMGTWLTEDVPDLMRANFRTITSRDGWAFMGSSTGGFAGLKAVLKHPDKFKAVIASGPDIAPDSRLWNGHEKEKAENNPKVLAKELIAKGGPDVYLAFQVGTKESNRQTLPNIRQFMKEYGKGPIHASISVIEGGRHNAYTYVPNMENGPIQFISKVMQGPVS